MPPANVYQHLYFNDPANAVSDDEFAVLEVAVRAAIPENVRQFIRAANGSSLDYLHEVQMHGTVEIFSVCDFFGMRPFAGKRDFYKALELARDRFEIPDGVLPLAHDAGTCPVFVDLIDGGNTQVVVYSEPLPSWTGSRQHPAGMYVAAHTFDDYVRKLFIDPHEAGELLVAARRDNDEPRLRAIAEWLDVGLPFWREMFDRTGALDRDRARAVSSASARAMGDAVADRRYIAAARHHDDIYRVSHALGFDHARDFGTLLASDDPAVLLWASYFSLRYASKAATTILKELACRSGYPADDAKFMLELWQEDELDLTWFEIEAEERETVGA